MLPKRKSTTGGVQLPTETGQLSTGKTPRSTAAFQLTKCNICLVELTKKDLPSRHDESVCKSLIECSLQLLNPNDDSVTLLGREIIFDAPFILNRHIVYTNSALNISKDKLEKGLNGQKAKDNQILLSPQLMQHCSLTNGQYVFVQFHDSSNRAQRHYLRAQSYDQLSKSCLQIALVKDSPCARALFASNGTNSSVIRIDLQLCSVALKSLSLQIENTFADPLDYLNRCCKIKRKLVDRVINSIDSEFSLEISETEQYNLKVKRSQQNSSNTVEHLESKLNNLLISERQSTATKTPSVYVICEDTEIIFSSLTDHSIAPNDFRMVGYNKQMELLDKLIVKPLSRKCDVPLPRSILLTGPSGSGKTMAMKEMFDRVHDKMNVVKIHASHFLSKSFEYEKLRNGFRNLIKLQPSLLFLDNLEDISSEKNQTEKRLVSWLKVLLDELPKKEPVIIVGATSRPDQLDTSLRRPGRFDIEAEFAIPTPADRKVILKQLLSVTGNCLEDEQIDNLAETAHGFTGADLKHLCELTMLQPMDGNSSGDGGAGQVTYKQLWDILRRMKPSIMREITLEKPNVHWSDVGGLHSLRHLLEETVVWPVKHPDAFVRLGIEPPRGILMYGPPGCAKTMIGKALATESGLNFFSIKGPELFSKWVGESERAIREMFSKARAAAPSILFFDEIDALAAERGQTQSAVGDRVLAQLLTEIDGVEKLSQVVIVAATNRPDIVDKALLRPGRLDAMVYVPLPDLATRREILQIRTGKMRLGVKSETERAQLIDHLAEQMKGYTGAEVTAVCQRAGLIALGESLSADSVSGDHFTRAIERVRPRIGAEMIAFYDEFATRCDELRPMSGNNKK